jgi:CRISP-associated protein Cas1
LIQQKFKNSIARLKTLPQSGARDRAIRKHDQELDVLTHRPPRTIDALLGIEGRAAFSYFGAWQSLPLRWRGTARHPIPEDWYRVGQRQSLNTRTKGRNRFASHPVNAILNYAYAVLESQVRMWIIAEGYDPTIGYLHTNSERRPVDTLITKLRGQHGQCPWADEHGGVSDDVNIHKIKRGLRTSQSVMLGNAHGALPVRPLD